MSSGESATPNFKTAQVKLTRVSKTIYMDPRAFNDREIMHTIEAISEWNDSTNNFVNFHLEFLPQRIVDFRSGILLIKVSPYYPDVIALDSLYGGPMTLGLFRSEHPVPHVLLVEGRVQDYNFRATLEHELGHVLGLSHDVGIEGVNTLMNPGQDMSSDHITRRDLDRLCKIYSCDSKSMQKNVPED